MGAGESCVFIAVNDGLIVVCDGGRVGLTARRLVKRTVRALTGMASAVMTVTLTLLTEKGL